MDKQDKHRLRQNHEFIVRNFDVIAVIDKLYEKGVITSTDQEKLRNNLALPTVDSKNREFLDMLPRRGPRAYSGFIEALEPDYNFIVQRLQNTKITEDTDDGKKWRCTGCSNTNPQSSNVCLGCEEERLYPFEGGQLCRDARITQRVTSVADTRIPCGEQVTGAEFNRCERRIIVIGKTGTGKSATCNTLVGREVFESKTSLHHVTMECVYAKSARCIKQQNFDLHIYDTPGALGDGFEVDKLASQLGRAILIMAPGPHCFVLVSKLTRPQGEMDMIKVYENIFGKGFYKHVIMLFTEKDLHGQKRKLEDFLENKNDFHNFLSRKIDNRYIWFNNMAIGGENDIQVTGLIDQIENMNRENLKSTHKDFYEYKIFSEAQVAIEQRVSSLRGTNRNITHGEALQIVREEVAEERPIEDSWWRQKIADFIGRIKTLISGYFEKRREKNTREQSEPHPDSKEKDEATVTTVSNN